MKASHNSLTAYPVRKWYMKPFNIFAKCQDKELIEQFKSGVKYFDLRFRYVDGRLYAAHGLMTYDCTAEYAIETLNNIALMSGKQIYFRAILEDIPKGERMTINSFRMAINGIMVGKCKNLLIHRLGLKSDWGNHIIYNDVKFTGNNRVDLVAVALLGSSFDMFHEKEFDPELPEPYVYEAYNYTFPIPRFSSWLIKKFAPSNSMRNFI